MEQPKICIVEVNENLRRVKLGMPLTKPLKELDWMCKFKQKYNENCNIEDGFPEELSSTQIDRKAYMKIYRKVNAEKLRTYNIAYQRKKREKLKRKIKLRRV